MYSNCIVNYILLYRICDDMFVETFVKFSKQAFGGQSPAHFLSNFCFPPQS